MKNNKYEIDMCNGTLMDKLISFSLPLMLSGILQLLFNAVDIIVVGRFTGSQALAAVGSTTALINIFTNLFIGISLGANVLAARFYASGKEKEMSETVHTSITLALISGLVMALAGVLLARFALNLMGTPNDVIDQSVLYMRIYFLGMPFFMLYNYGAAILRAVGDTKRPLFFLVDLRYDQCSSEPCTGYCVSYGSGRCSHRNYCVSADLQYSGASLSLHFQYQLPAVFFKIRNQNTVSEADLPGRNTGRYPEYSDQPVQCSFAVFCKLFWFCGNGRIYCCQ